MFSAVYPIPVGAGSVVVAWSLVSPAMLCDECNEGASRDEAVVC